MPFHMSVVCCQGEVSGSGRSLVQRNPTECGVSKWSVSEETHTEGLCSLGLSNHEKTITHFSEACRTTICRVESKCTRFPSPIHFHLTV